MVSAKVLYFSGEIPQGDPEGDQRTLFRKLKLLSKERDHVVLASLLECVTLALKDECSRLSQLHRDMIPPFEGVLDLTDHVVQLRKTPLGGAIERVLVLVFQLGSFVAYVSPSHSMVIKSSPVFWQDIMRPIHWSTISQRSAPHSSEGAPVYSQQLQSVSHLAF
jgi:hypothetical protein